MGNNARASIVTRGLAETIKFTEKLGGDKKTVWGLSGLGDIFLSCSSSESRNMNFGLALGSKIKIPTDLAEGKYSVKLITKRAEFEKIEMPICQAVNEIINFNADIDKVIIKLLSREIKYE